MMSTDDAYRLDKLAEELAERDLAGDGEYETVDLPLYVPLAHTNEYLTADVFNVEDFLRSRAHTSLPDLRSELRDYLSTLKEELVKLINDDYEAFISLSTDLQGEGARLERLKQPLAGIRSEIIESKQELQVIQNAIRDKLETRKVLREEKALLHLLLKISESVTRLESLLVISSKDTSPDPGLKLPHHLSMDEDTQDDRMRGNRAKHLGRVATEYTQLLYHVSKARVDKCVFVDEIQWRIDRVHSTLSSDLDHIFSGTLLGLIDGKAITEIEKAKLTTDLTECLRTYDILGLWRDAEDVLRREIVRSFLKKTIFPGALSVPHSPLVPHTPFPTRSSETSAFGLFQQQPRTPYTPFSAFALKQNPFDSRGSTSSPYAHLLDDSDDPLARLYNQVLRFVERDLCKIMGIAEKVSVRSSGSRHINGPTSAVVLKSPVKPTIPKASSEGFEIMANVVWAEFGQAIIDELGSVVFSAGRPDEFRQHHETTQAFIRSLEYLAPSMQSIEAMRAHPVYSAFDRRWQRQIYFQLRWKEIVGRVEDSLSTRVVEPMATPPKNSFLTNEATAIGRAVSSCWSAEVYIPELSHRFWKLSLQLISRYKTWLDTSLPTLESSPKSSIGTGFSTDRNMSSATLSRVPTPTPASDPLSAETTAADDLTIRQCATAIVDIQTMQSFANTIWTNEISMMLPESFEGDEGQPEDALKYSLERLTSLIPPMSEHIITLLTKRCCDALLPVRSIPSQFRAMSNKRPPTEPSYFVASILRPIKAFFGIGMADGPGSLLKNVLLKEYAPQIFESTAQRYVYYLSAMRKTEESLRRLKKGKRSTFSLFGNSNAAKEDEGRDEERIRTQMILDVEAFGKEAQALTVDLESSEAFASLQTMVHAQPSELPEAS